MERLYDKLKAYSESDFYAFHMPGHKRNKALLGIELPYDLDITEIDGFDDLHHADGILKEEQERAARVFGAEESHFLVNGSTVGILSAVMGCTHRGDKILVARHCHKSIYHAIYMNGLVPRYALGTIFWNFWQAAAFRKLAAALATTLMQLAYRNMIRCSWWKRHRDGWRRITNGSRSSDIPYQ